MLTHPRDVTNPWDSDEVKAVMDLCLSCKGCKSECPSNVDVARLKAEWQQHYYDANGVPLRSRLIAGFTRAMRLAALAPSLYNWLVTSPTTSTLDQKLLRLRSGTQPAETPSDHSCHVASAKHANPAGQAYPNGRVYLFCDEFTDYNDTDVGIKAVTCSTDWATRSSSRDTSRAAARHLSKGLVRDAASSSRSAMSSCSRMSSPMRHR